MSEARSLIFPAFCEHITWHSGDIFAQAASSLTGSPSSSRLPVPFLSPDGDDDATSNPIRSRSYGASRRVASRRIALHSPPPPPSSRRVALFSPSGSSPLSPLVVPRPFVPATTTTAETTASEYRARARVKPLRRGDSFTLTMIAPRNYFCRCSAGIVCS